MTALILTVIIFTPIILLVIAAIVANGEPNPKPMSRRMYMLNDISHMRTQNLSEVIQATRDCSDEEVAEFHKKACQQRLDRLGL